MKKKLLIIGLLLSGSVSNTHTMFAAALAMTSGKAQPKITTVGSEHEVKKYKGKEVTSSNPSVVKVEPTENGYKLTAKKTGTAQIMVDGKAKGDKITVAHTSIKTLPKEIMEDTSHHIDNNDKEMKLIQTNKNDNDAGKVRITQRKKHHGNVLTKITAKDDGPVVLKDENSGNEYKFVVVDDDNDDD